MFERVFDLSKEICGAWRISGSYASFLRLALDFPLSRMLRFLPRAWRNRPRLIRLRDNTVLQYRLNRGDLWSLREVWIFEAYRLPFQVDSNALPVVVDLGCNIGFTSLWISRRYQVNTFVAVEPDASNCAIAEQNFTANNLAVELITAAVGASDGEAYFEASESSNMGSLQAQGTTKVRLVSMATVLGTLGAGEKIDLLKIDIEGGEQELLMGELSWLDRVRAIIIEFHPEYVDYPLLCERIVACGFTYIPGGSSFPDSMDAFVRATVDTAIISEDANANS